MEDKALLLKTLHTSDTKIGLNELELTSRGFHPEYFLLKHHKGVDKLPR